MEQISLEDKVNNTLKWLANQIACTQVYKKWNEEFKKESLDDAWQKVQEQFKKDIDWNALTESQCKALHFGSWQSEEDIEEEISYLQSQLDKGNLTKEEFDKRVANEKNTLGLRLIPLNILAKSLIPKVNELLNLSPKSMRSSIADAIYGLSECDEEFKTKFKQLLNETKLRFQKEFDEI
jgi:hypothetical protein